LARTFRLGACAASATAVICLSLGMAPAEAATTTGWRLTEVYGTGAANIYPAAEPYDNGALATPSRGAAWAIFESCTWPCTGAPSSLVEHWNGRHWAPVPATDLNGLSPDLVAASSAKDAWLFQNDPAAALRWDGSSWKEVAVPQWAFVNAGLGGQYLYAADVAPGNVWVFDQTDYSTGRKAAYAAHYSDGKWTKSYLPAEPIEVDALGANDIWADGASVTGKGPTVLMHWTGGRWSTIDVPRQSAGGGPDGLAGVGEHGVWVGWSPAGKKATGYVLHWDGADWAKASLPSGDNILSLASDGDGGLWVNGVGPLPRQEQLFLHWSAGRWTSTPVPGRRDAQLGQVDDISMIPGTRSLWAIGHLYGPAASRTLNRGAIWRYNP
jgi:hypothetical protein